jgi:hypothetical protein
MTLEANAVSACTADVPRRGPTVVPEASGQLHNPIEGPARSPRNDFNTVIEV